MEAPALIKWRPLAGKWRNYAINEVERPIAKTVTYSLQVAKDTSQDEANNDEKEAKATKIASYCSIHLFIESR
jgi:hypothetical protein